jgi:hypothetical protein
LLNPDEGDDNLGLLPKLRQRLNDSQFLASRGKKDAAAVVYVDADEMPGAIRPAGTYQVTGNKIQARINLRQDGKTIATLSVSGERSNLDQFVQTIVQAIAQELAKK